MPEYQPPKQKSQSQEGRMNEYRRVPVQKKKQPSIFGSKKKKRAKIEQETRTALPPQSPVRRERAAELRRHEELQSEARRISKRKGRKRKKSLLLYKLMFGILVIGVLSVLSVTVLFNISEITVSGSEKYSEEEIKAACGIKIGDNLLRIDIGGAEEKTLKSLVYADSVSINRSFPNRLSIVVQDSVPMANIFSGGKYYLVSYSGKLLDILDSPTGCIQVNGFLIPEAFAVGDVLQENETKQLEALKSIVSELSLQQLEKTAVLDLSDMMNISVLYDSRIQMELGAVTQLHEKLYAAAVLVKEEINDTDRLTMMLQNPERVVTRPIYDGGIEDGGYIAETTAEESMAEEITAEETTEPDGSYEETVPASVSE